MAQDTQVFGQASSWGGHTRPLESPESQQPDSMILAIVTQPLVDVIKTHDQSIRIVAKVLTEGEGKELLLRFVRETREGKIGERSDNLC